MKDDKLYGFHFYLVNLYVTHLNQHSDWPFSMYLAINYKKILMIDLNLKRYYKVLHYDEIDHLEINVKSITFVLKESEHKEDAIMKEKYGKSCHKIRFDSQKGTYEIKSILKEYMPGIQIK